MNNLDPTSRLANIIKSLKKQKNTYLVLKGSIILFISFLFLIAAGSILSLISQTPYYLAGLKIVIVLTVLYLLFKLIFNPLRANKKSSSFLDKLNEISKGLKEDTLNAIELARDINKSDIHGTSEELAYGHISKTTLKLESFDLSSLYKFKEFRKYLLPLFGAILFAGLATYLTSGSFGNYFFSSNLLPEKSESNLELADIKISLNFPAYTKLDPKVLEGGSETIEAIKGAEIYIEATPLRKFKDGELILQNGVSVPVEVINGKIKSQFTVLSDNSFVIRDTQTGLDSKSFNIQATTDNEPVVKLYSPSGDNLELGAEDSVEIFYEAEDDFEISKITLNWENQRNRTEKPLEIRQDRNETIKGKLNWSPAGVNPEDGDTIKLRIYAYDNDTISGPNVGISNAITIKLKDARSKHRETLNLAEQFMEELIDILGDEINLSFERKRVIPDDGPELATNTTDPGQIIKQQKKLTQKIENSLRTLDKTLSAMSEDEYSDYTFFVALTNMDLRIHDLLDERKYFVESATKIDAPRIKNLMEREIIEFENDILLLDSMLKGDKLIDSLRSSNELLNEYKDLSELLSELKNGDDDEIAKQIQDKLDQIKDLMSKLAKQMDGLGGEIQEGFLNQDAFEALDMQNQLDQISKLAQEGKIEEALNMLASMSESLQNMIASLENGMQSFGSSMMAKEMSKLNDLISRIDNIEKEESVLKQNTEDLKASLLENPDLPGQNLRDFIDKQMNKISELKGNLNQARAKIENNPSAQTSPEGAYLIEKMIEKTQELENWLKATDFNEAEKSAKSIQESTLGLKEMSNSNYGSLGKAFQEMAKANSLANEIRNDLKQFTSSGSGQGPFGKMASRQDEIQNETGELNQELTELGSGFFVSPGLGEKLGQAEGFMENASQDLKGKFVSKAISNQDEAIKSLREAKEQAQEMLQQMKMSAKGNGSPAPMMLGQRQRGQSPQGKDTMYVEIPVADESQVGKEYKQRILEAMKDGSPEGYLKLNKKYYDRIIK